MNDEVTDTPRRRRRRSGVALVAAGALLMSGPVVAATSVSGAFASESSGGDGSYVPPDPNEYGSITVSEGKLDAVTTGEAVKVGLDAKGVPHHPILIQQLEVTGNGKYKIEDPAPAELPKNINDLDPFTFPVVDGKAVFEGEVGDGDESTTKAYRWIGLMDANRLAFGLEVQYKMNGRVYDDPADMVGMSGQVEVLYTWTAKGARPTTLTWGDANTGGLVQQQVDVYLPMVGVFKAPLPSNFTQVRGITMDAAPDGYGGTLLAGTLVMFPPLGPTEIQVGFTANVQDFFMPTILCEFVLANTPDNASFAVIGDVLGALGTGLGGASASLAGVGPSLAQVGSTLDGISNLFGGLNTATKELGRTATINSGVAAAISAVNAKLGQVIGTGAPNAECDVGATVSALLAIIKGEAPPTGVTYCDLTDLQAKATEKVSAIKDRAAGQVKPALDPILADLSGILSLSRGSNLFPTGVTNTRPLTPGLYDQIGPCATVDRATAPDGPKANPIGTVYRSADGSTVTNGNGQAKNTLYVANDPNLATRLGADPVAALTGLIASASQNTYYRGVLGLSNPLQNSLDDLYEANRNGDSPNAFSVRDSSSGPSDAGCADNAFGNLAAATDLLVLLKDKQFQDDFADYVDSSVALLTMNVTTTVLTAMAGLQTTLSDVTRQLSGSTTLNAGVVTAIGSISTRVNEAIVGLLGGIVGGLGNSLPALSTSLGETASTLNEEYALFQSFGFMALYGGAQPYGPPWKPNQVPGWAIDPNTGAPVPNPPPTAGAVTGGTTAPASSTQPVSDSHGTPTPLPGVPEPDTSDPVSQIDKRGYTAFQVDIFGVGGERTATWGLYSGAILLLLAGGIGGGLIAKARRK